MDKRKIYLLAILVSGAAVLAAPVSADSPASPPTKADTSQSKPAAATPSHTPPANCLQETGTRVRLKPGHCVAAPSRVWSRDDIDSTGAATAGGVIRQLGVH